MVVERGHAGERAVSRPPPLRARNANLAAPVPVATPATRMGILAAQQLAGNQAVCRLLAGPTGSPAGSVPLPDPLPVQRGRVKKAGARRKAKSKRAAWRKQPRYAEVKVAKKGGKWVVTKVKPSGRPPSSSRRGQGDHIVAYTLMAHAVSTSAEGKELKDAAGGLKSLLASSSTFVTKAGTNSWWHRQAQSVVDGLDTVVSRPDDSASEAFPGYVSSSLALMNMMPGTAIKNPKSTGGHGEGGSGGGLEHVETVLQKRDGTVVPGNVWTNVIAMLDLTADKQLMDNDARLESKIAQLALFAKTAAPLLFELLKAGNHAQLPGTDLAAAVRAKLGAMKRLDRAAFLEGLINAHLMA